MAINEAGEAAKTVVRRNTEEVQGGGNFDLFDELFADDFVDHTPQPGAGADKAGVRELYAGLRKAFPDSGRRSTGSRLTVTSSRHTRSTTARIVALSSAWHPLD